MIAGPATGPFFKRAEGGSRAGQRFCFYHAPGTTPRGAVLAVHAFAEEMNKTRVAAADGARALAAAGFAVLQIDLVGCGDSDGDFEDATWDGWLADLADGWAWLQDHAAGPRWVWGTRLGALLADAFATRCVPPADGLLLWQPVVNGAQHLGQFLRLKTVGGMLRESATTPSAATSTPTAPSAPIAKVAEPSPRADLASGNTIEVAGYFLTPVLADAIEAARLGTLDGGGVRVPARVRWFEVSSQPQATITPIATRVVERWRSVGSDVAVATIVGPAFWQTQEVERCAELVAATVAALTEPVPA